MGAGVYLAVLAWRVVPVFHVMRAHVLRLMFAYPCSGKTTLGRLVGCMCKGPTLTGVGDGVASGATKLVPATLSGLAQCERTMPLTIPGKVLHALGCLLGLALPLVCIDEFPGFCVGVDGVRVQVVE